MTSLALGHRAASSSWEPAAMGLVATVQVAIEGREGMTPPGKGHQDDQDLKVVEVIVEESVFERIKENVQFWRNADDLEHNGNLHSIPCSLKRCIEPIAVFVEIPSHDLQFPAKKSVNLSKGDKN